MLRIEVKRSASRDAGFTLLEVIIVLVVLAVLAGAAYPLMRNSVRREREVELRESLREIRQAIDAYKRYHDQTGGQAIPIQWRTVSGYPKILGLPDPEAQRGPLRESGQGERPQAPALNVRRDSAEKIRPPRRRG